MDDYLVDIKHESFSFFTPRGEVKAVRDVSLHMKAGEVLGLVGESGCGKSVTASALMGLTAPGGRITGGEVYFNGHRIDRMSEKELREIRGREISIIFQDPMTALNPVYTVGSQLVEALERAGSAGASQSGDSGSRRGGRQSRREKLMIAQRLLSLAGIKDPERRLKQYPHELSGGMKQRVMIAMALAGGPRLIIADEPTTALDVTIQAQILELIASLKDKFGMAVLLITHDLGVVASMCDNVAVMYAGEIVEYGSCDDIFYRPAHVYTKGLLGAVPRLDENRSAKLASIDGRPPDLIDPPVGCPFAARCASCMRICLERKPEKAFFEEGSTRIAFFAGREGAGEGAFEGAALSGGHYSACWLHRAGRFG